MGVTNGRRGDPMDKEPRLLVWNYTMEEKAKLDERLKEVGAPFAVSIQSAQGCLTLREIIHTGGQSETPFTSAEKAIIFYNIPQKGILFLINLLKETDLPRPIYAVATVHSMEWPFCKLLEHLVEERERIEKGPG
jgi:hypothetical protein